MKNVTKLFGIIAVAAVIGLTFAVALAACGGGAAGGDTSITYPTAYDALGNSYSLTISRAGASRAALYTPRAGDAFELKIGGFDRVKNENVEIGKSTGAVRSVTGGSGLELAPKTGGSFKATISGGEIKNIDDNIPLDDGGEQEAPPQDSLETVVAGGAPKLTEFITLPAIFSSEYKLWNPKIVWQKGGIGNKEIEEFSVAIRGVVGDLPLKKFVLTVGDKTFTNSSDAPDKTYGSPNKSITWWIGTKKGELTSLVAGNYTATIYVVDTAGNKSGDKTTTFTIVP
jgi:hypothetical protein